MTDGILITGMNREDAREVVRVAEALPEWFTPSGIDTLRSDVTQQHGFVAKEGDEIVGFLTFFVNQRIAQIGWMGIHPDRHRHGIGRMLVERLREHAAPNGIKAIRVETLGDAVEYDPYARTRAFYRALGFEDFRRERQDNPECPELLVMSLPLHHGRR